MKAMSGKKYTAKELAAQFGCSVDTVQNHANKLFGKAQNGVARLFDEAQVTIILESVKGTQANREKTGARPIGNDMATSARLLGAETHLTPILRLKLISEEKDRLHAEEIAIYRNEVKRLEELSARQAAWIDDTLAANTMLFRIAESAGALTSDRDDMLATYRRR